MGAHPGVGCEGMHSRHMHWIGTFKIGQWVGAHLLTCERAVSGAAWTVAFWKAPLGAPRKKGQRVHERPAATSIAAYSMSMLEPWLSLLWAGSMQAQGVTRG